MECHANIRPSVFPHVVAPAPGAPDGGLLPVWHDRRYGWSTGGTRAGRQEHGIDMENIARVLAHIGGRWYFRSVLCTAVSRYRRREVLMPARHRRRATGAWRGRDAG